MEKNKKYNILYTSSFGSLKGGGQRSLLLLLKNLDKEKYNPYLLVPESGELSDAAKALAIKVIEYPISSLRSLNLAATMRSFGRLRKIIEKFNIDLIHTDGPRETIYAGILKIYKKVPVVIHLRVSDASFLLDRILYYLSDHLIAVSRALLKRFNLIKGQEKISVVYNAVDLHDFQVVQKKPRGKKLKVGYFGRITRRKGVEILIKAVKRIKDIARLIIIGSEDEKYLAQLKKLSRGVPVTFEEYQPDIREKIADIDVVVLPSIRGEGLSRIIIESMAMGKVVVASNMEENKEALGQDLNEFVFSNGNDLELSMILKRIHENRQILEDLKPNLRRKAERLFDVTRNTKQIEEIYENLILRFSNEHEE